MSYISFYLVLIMSLKLNLYIRDDLAFNSFDVYLRSLMRLASLQILDLDLHHEEYTKLPNLNN